MPHRKDSFCPFIHGVIAPCLPSLRSAHDVKESYPHFAGPKGKLSLVKPPLGNSSCPNQGWENFGVALPSAGLDDLMSPSDSAGMGGQPGTNPALHTEQAL